MVEVSSDDVRVVAEVLTDVAALTFGLQALGFHPVQNLAAIDPTNPILGLIAVLALVSFIGTFELMQEKWL